MCSIPLLSICHHDLYLHHYCSSHAAIYNFSSIHDDKMKAVYTDNCLSLYHIQPLHILKYRQYFQLMFCQLAVELTLMNRTLTEC